MKKQFSNINATKCMDNGILSKKRSNMVGKF